MNMLENINTFITSAFGNIIQYIISILSIMITFLTFLKVGKVKKSQEKYKKLVRLDDIISVLKEVSYLFDDILEYSHINDETKYRIKSLQKDIIKGHSTIDAINTALFDENNDFFTPTYKDDGYFSHVFFDEIISKAKSCVKIYCKRNNLLFENEEQLTKLFNAVSEKGVKIEIVSISTQCSDTLLKEINKSLPHPNKSITDLKEEQEKNKKDI